MRGLRWYVFLPYLFIYLLNKIDLNWDQVCAFVSLLTGASVSPNIAMTGEVCISCLFLRIKLDLYLDYLTRTCYASGWNKRKGSSTSPYFILSTAF